MDVAYQITAPHFTAGIETKGGKVTTAAPIVHYMVGWGYRQVFGYCSRKKWKLERVPTLPKLPDGGGRR